MRSSKHDNLVESVELTHVNPTYAHVRHNDGRESTVSLSDLAPCPRDSEETHLNRSIVTADPEMTACDNVVSDKTAERNVNISNQSLVDESAPVPSPTDAVRRSSRIKKKPQKYGFEDD